MRKAWKPAMCECGRGPKETNQGASVPPPERGCRYCNELDGRTRQEREVINLLRDVSGGLPVSAVASELGRKYNTAQVNLHRMVRRGRLRAMSAFEDESWNNNKPVEYRLAPLHSRGAR